MARFKPLPPLDRVRDLLDYNSKTGVFTWNVGRRGTARKGSVAGHFSNGYLRIKIDDSLFTAHRLAWYISTGKDPGDSLLDHKDGDKTNNSLSNLRLADTPENGWNRKVSSNNRLKVKGVSYNKQKGKYVSAIMFNGKRKFLGYFETVEEASEAYKKAAQEFHGDFARLS